MKTYIQFLLVLSVAVTPGNGFAFSYWTYNGTPWHWVGANATMDLHPASFPLGDPFTEQLIQAQADWTDVIGSRMVYNWQIVARDVQNHADGFNAAAWVPDNCDDWIGATFVRHQLFSAALVDTDIWFDSDCFPWWVPSSPTREIDANAPDYSFRNVAQHELGHALGLNHEFSAVATMNYGERFDRLHADDKAGSRFLYAGPVSDLDLSVTNAVDDAPGGYQRYVAPLPGSVEPGFAFQVEYTVENMGTIFVGNVGVGFYLGNYFIDRVFFDFPPGSVGSFSHTLPIPSGIPAGNYPLYVHIDDRDVFAENNEANNQLPNPWGTIEVIAAPSSCGNNIAEGVEWCDGEDTRSAVCEDFGYASGILQCLPDCTDLSFTACSMCGNVVCDAGESRCNCPQDCGDWRWDPFPCQSKY